MLTIAVSTTGTSFVYLIFSLGKIIECHQKVPQLMRRFFNALLNKNTKLLLLV
jgi:hypothetical protein